MSTITEKVEKRIIVNKQRWEYIALIDENNRKVGFKFYHVDCDGFAGDNNTCIFCGSMVPVQSFYDEKNEVKKED